MQIKIKVSDIPNVLNDIKYYKSNPSSTKDAIEHRGLTKNELIRLCKKYSVKIYSKNKNRNGKSTLLTVDDLYKNLGQRLILIEDSIKKSNINSVIINSSNINSSNINKSFIITEKDEKDETGELDEKDEKDETGELDEKDETSELDEKDETGKLDFDSFVEKFQKISTNPKNTIPHPRILNNPMKGLLYGLYCSNKYTDNLFTFYDPLIFNFKIGSASYKWFLYIFSIIHSDINELDSLIPSNCDIFYALISFIFLLKSLTTTNINLDDLNDIRNTFKEYVHKYKNIEISFMFLDSSEPNLKKIIHEDTDNSMVIMYMIYEFILKTEGITLFSEIDLNNWIKNKNIKCKGVYPVIFALWGAIKSLYSKKLISN